MKLLKYYKQYTFIKLNTTKGTTGPELISVLLNSIRLRFLQKKNNCMYLHKYQATYSPDRRDWPVLMFFLIIYKQWSAPWRRSANFYKVYTHAPKLQTNAQHPINSTVLTIVRSTKTKTNIVKKAMFSKKIDYTCRAVSLSRTQNCLRGFVYLESAGIAPTNISWEQDSVP